MEDLDALPVNQVMLKKNPDIMKTIKMVGSQVSVTSLMDIHVVSPDRDFTINFVYENPWVGITSSFQFVSCLSSTGIQCKTSYSALQKHSDSSFALPELYDHFFSFNRHVNAYPGLRIKKMTTEHVCLHFKVHVMRVHYPILFSCVLLMFHSLSDSWGSTRAVRRSD